MFGPSAVRRRAGIEYEPPFFNPAVGAVAVPKQDRVDASHFPCRLHRRRTPHMTMNENERFASDIDTSRTWQDRYEICVIVISAHRVNWSKTSKRFEHSA
jgi:hypothetical protein